MKKISFSIKASVIYTIIGILVTLSNLSEKTALSRKSYNYEWGIFERIADGIKMIGYDLIFDIFGVPSLIAGLCAGTLACIALHI